MKLSRFLLCILMAAPAALAQSAQNWYPQDIEALGQNASSRTEFSLDRSMLVLASKVDNQDDNLRHVIAGVDGISIHRFKYVSQGMYDPRILDTVRHEYSEAGWQHISKAHDKYGYPRDAELWVHLDHNVIRNIAVLFTNADQVNFVSVSGSISPIDLLHLGGHFGIPRIQAGVTMPAPGTGPQAEPPPPSAPSPSNDDDYRHPQTQEDAPAPAPAPDQNQ